MNGIYLKCAICCSNVEHAPMELLASPQSKTKGACPCLPKCTVCLPPAFPSPALGPEETMDFSVAKK